ncbi:type VI secretion system contractile sheath small subunit [Ketobacter sp. MCCC 1A13808]|uniref:type VI secretion system contractile sheath small subunit n=1 Tax=Ketobacter sp. MCCC 1A13808 TaxID=2602738 RepID=UPI000F2CAEF4|nr:type VI secretion system contractile sheath small subunit [Ketobacter sp. MCCC 1A13808]MVF10931.1 type VI secretion system contractile sheath small subunit [Ketobacter sp. MCCC 1A13808]RLP56322.1 MAG: type VI secretion system contractile sheath small subunit [Ketobacter sp.]
MSKEGTVAPKERINIKYRSESGGVQETVELPLKMMVLGDFTQREDERVIEDRKPISVDKHNFDDVLRSQKVGVDVAVPNRLSNEEDSELGVSLQFESMKDFSPENVAKQVPELKKMLELREALVALKGPLGNVPAFRKAIESILKDEQQRDLVLGELKIEG